MRRRLRGIDGKNRGGLLQAVKQRFEELAHRLQVIIVEQGSHAFPQPALPTHLGPCSLEQRTAHLLDLIDEKRQLFEAYSPDSRILVTRNDVKEDGSRGHERQFWNVATILQNSESVSLISIYEQYTSTVSATTAAIPAHDL